jgi:hypothetical protein
MARLIALWQSEPARVVGFVTAFLAVVAAFGLPITDDQQVKIIAAVAAGLFLLGSAEVTRSRVTPAGKAAIAKDAAFQAGFVDGRTTARVNGFTMAPTITASDNLTSASVTTARVEIVKP